MPLHELENISESYITALFKLYRRIGTHIGLCFSDEVRLRSVRLKEMNLSRIFIRHLHTEIRVSYWLFLNDNYSIKSAIFPYFAHVTTGTKPCVNIVTRSCYSPVSPMRNTYRAQ
jgi:hypothetical protein